MRAHKTCIKAGKSTGLLITRSRTGQQVPLRVHPGVYTDKVCYEARNGAFENCIIANDNTLTEYVDFKMLICH